MNTRRRVFAGATVLLLTAGTIWGAPAAQALDYDPDMTYNVPLDQAGFPGSTIFVGEDTLTAGVTPTSANCAGQPLAFTIETDPGSGALGAHVSADSFRATLKPGVNQCDVFWTDGESEYVQNYTFVAPLAPGSADYAINSASKVYGEADPALTTTFAATSEYTLEIEREPGEAVGTYDIAALVTLNDPLFFSSVCDWTQGVCTGGVIQAEGWLTDGFTITQRPATITGGSVTAVATGEEIVATVPVTVSPTTPLAPGDKLVSPTTLEIRGTAVGVYQAQDTIVIENADGVDVTANYNLTVAPGMLVILPNVPMVGSVKVAPADGVAADGLTSATVTIAVTNPLGEPWQDVAGEAAVVIDTSTFPADAKVTLTKGTEAAKDGVAGWRVIPGQDGLIEFTVTSATPGTYTVTATTEREDAPSVSANVVFVTVVKADTGGFVPSGSGTIIPIGAIATGAGVLTRRFFM
ncbi:MAG: hypothetical protein LBI33_00220 [Propionibacteriaceae bacterium]|jgi:hypothetical protein|nr:hypothetical protein [Propionibacteriaceae bacterium]